MSQGTYKIESAEQGRTYDGKYGQNTVWLVTLQGAQAETPSGKFELHKKAGATIQPGQEIEVERFIPGEFQGDAFVRIKQVYNQGTGGGQSRSSASGEGPGLTWASKPYERGAEHPRNEARMIHTSALSAAPAFVEQMLTVGVASQPKDEDAYWALVGHVADRLTKTYQRVLEGVAGPPAPVQATLNGGDVPADTAGLVAAPAPDGDDLPF